MSEAKPTPGPWRFERHDGGQWFGNIVSYGLGTTEEGVQIIRTIDCLRRGVPEEEMLATALLIAEAGTVYHETSLTPRQFAEQRAELLAALHDAADFIKGRDRGNPAHETGWESDEHLDAWLKVRAAIAKAENRDA